MKTLNKWEANPTTLTAQSFYDLFDNKIPCIVVDNFLTPSECEAMFSVVMKSLGQYDYQFDVNSAPPAQHLFETHYLYENKTPEEYFPVAEKSLHDYQKLCDQIHLYPDKKMMEYLGKILQKPVRIASQDGKLYSHVIIRELKNSALLHADFAPFIPGYWSISNIIAEYAWNIYLTHPGKGGECIVYNKPWEKEDDKFIVGDTYGYSHDVVQDKEFTEIYPEQGRLVFFNSRNFHEVKSSENVRVSVGGHVGLMPTGEIILWV